ncbi:MAG: hypothetical protein VST70_04555 [Nitrospirota bacterium]|nr:hypothetical protein [Nitrospirota bacterium]
MGGQTFGSMAQGITAGTQGIGALIMYVFALLGVILAGNGIYGFYQAHHNNQPGQFGKAAAKTIVGIVLAGGLMYMINSGSMTMGAGTNSTLQNVVAP